jgi:hypothetical protein
MNLLVIAQIANAFATLANNSAFSSSATEMSKVSSVAGLVGLALNAGGMLDSERALLLEQIERANLEGRLLTDEEMNAWKERHAAAKAAIENWQPG